MKKILLTLTLSLLFQFVYASPVKLKGKIGGKYAIEMEIDQSKDKEHPIQGKYNYEGKTAFLTLKGEMYSDNVVYLDEFNKDQKNTGTFYLEYADKQWKGFWVSKEKHFTVELQVVSGDMKEFKEFDFIELQKECNSKLTGSYANDFYFINDMWLHESGNVEIGFNGGVVSVTEIHKDTLKIKFELLCGPTYHTAWFDGYAVKIGKNEYEYNQSLYGDGEACHLIFTFENKKLSITQKSSSMDCEFGARAYADGEFTKIKDKVSSKESVGIGDVLELK